ncbi:MAG: hypothetical protein Q9220_000884 [cf. Caloplaca sp. 1 TL-2023]
MANYIQLQKRIFPRPTEAVSEELYTQLGSKIIDPIVKEEGVYGRNPPREPLSQPPEETDEDLEPKPQTEEAQAEAESEVQRGAADIPGSPHSVYQTPPESNPVVNMVKTGFKVQKVEGGGEIRIYVGDASQSYQKVVALEAKDHVKGGLPAETKLTSKATPKVGKIIKKVIATAEEEIPELEPQSVKPKKSSSPVKKVIPTGPRIPNPSVAGSKRRSDPALSVTGSVSKRSRMSEIKEEDKDDLDHFLDSLRVPYTSEDPSRNKIQALESALAHADWIIYSCVKDIMDTGRVEEPRDRAVRWNAEKKEALAYLNDYPVTKSLVSSHDKGTSAIGKDLANAFKDPDRNFLE